VISSNNIDAVKFADWIVLAVKPFQVKDVLSEIQPHLDAKKHVLISVVTGVWIKDLQEMWATSLYFSAQCPILPLLSARA
jgi:pyrroline-5-carboxylate reductase